MWTITNLHVFPEGLALLRQDILSDDSALRIVKSSGSIMKSDNILLLAVENVTLISNTDKTRDGASRVCATTQLLSDSSDVTTVTIHCDIIV